MALAHYADMIAAVNHAMSTRSIAGSASSGGILPGTRHGGSRRVAPAHARGVGVEGLTLSEDLPPRRVVINRNTYCLPISLEI